MYAGYYGCIQRSKSPHITDADQHIRGCTDVYREQTGHEKNAGNHHRCCMMPGEVIRSIPAERLSINGLNRLCRAAERIAPEDLKTLVQLLADKDHPSQGPSLGGLSM